MFVILKRSTILGILLTNLINLLTLSNCDTSGDDNTDDSEEDVKLKQALLLVELLKTDYAKALNENVELRNGKTDELSTCAVTTEKTGSNTKTKAYSAKLVRDNSDVQKENPVSDLATNSTNSEAAEMSNIISSSSNIFDSPSTPHPTPWAQSQLFPSAVLNAWPPAAPHYGVTQQPFAQLPQFRNNRRNPYGFYRRMIPNDYYYYDIPEAARSVRRQFRRFNYFDAFGEHPNNTDVTTVRTSALPKKSNSKKPIKNLSTTAGSSTLSPRTISASSSELKTTINGTTVRAGSTTKKSKPKHTRKLKKHTKTTIKSQAITTSSSKLNNKSSSNPKTTESPSTATQKHKKLNLNFYEVIDTSPTFSTIDKSITNDPVMSQVASELFDEFKGENVMKWKEKITKSKGTRRSDLSRTPLMYKTTMKIHLEGSTRYPIPLPENHAFCYTNPYNALCRTFI